MLQFELAARQLRRVKAAFHNCRAADVGSRCVPAGSGRRQQMLRQDDAGAQSLAVGSMTAFSDAVKAIAGSNDPGIGGWALQVLAEVLEHGWRLRRERSKVIDRLVYAGRKAGGRDVMPEDSAVHYLREETSIAGSVRACRCGIFSCPSGANVS